MDIHTVENFFGVYMLYCTNPKYLGRTYIGFTVNPNRRINQHNKGKKFGGAWKTSERGPWKMVLIIHGFPNNIAALRFEWAWQHPQRSRRLQHVPRKKSNEKMFDYNFRLLSEMLRVGPWNRLPLIIRWLDQSFAKDFEITKSPPMHMSICFGNVISKKADSKQKTCSTSETDYESKYCRICQEKVIGKMFTCLNKDCTFGGHIICFSKYFLKPGEYVPIEGDCPGCNTRFLWGDLVKKYKGCYNEEIVFNIENEMYGSFLNDSE